MIIKLERDQMGAELAELTTLIESLPANDYLSRLGLESRRDEVQHKFMTLVDHEEYRAKVALYFGGEPVFGSKGVKADFGSKAVGSFQDLLSKVWVATEGGQLLPMGPIRDRSAAQLHITNLVHGSFGFLLEELDAQGEPMFKTALCKAADQTAEYIASFAGENEDSFSSVIEDLNPRVFQSLREFFGCIHKNNATFRLVEGSRDFKFDHLAVERAWSRAENSNIDEEQTQVRGKLLGVIPIGRRFEFQPDGGATIIEGKVGEQFSNTYLERISTQQFAGRRWNALFHKRMIAKTGRAPAEKFTLLELDEIGAE